MKSVYIHIPFCRTLCSYCDFAKLLYYPQFIKPYLIALQKEIETHYQQEIINTIYIGGGTPTALTKEELKQLLDITSIFHKSDTYEFTVECNIENLDIEKMRLLYEYGVNRISIGIQTFEPKYLKLLNRHHQPQEVFEKITQLKQIGFTNINVDLMYAFPNQTIKELENDIETFLLCDVPHISTYSLMIEPNTILGISNQQPIDDSDDAKMYEKIIEILEKHHYQHYETSNFARNTYTSKHNLTYWNNEHYYGFGLGASGFVDNIRYINTRNFNHYINNQYDRKIENLSHQQMIENEFILNLRKTEGINKDIFYHKYKIRIMDIPLIQKLIKEKKLEETTTHIRLTKEYLYIANLVLVEFINGDFLIGGNYDQ